MFFGVSHLELPVTDLARARRFYTEALGFPVKQDGEGFCDVDTHSVLLRLVEVRRVEQHATLRLQVGDVAAAYAALLAAGAKALYPPERTPQLELMAQASDPDGHGITVWRALSEDEYGYLPTLPIQQTWDSEAEALLKSLLTRVPSLFRGLARRKVVQEAEAIATARQVGREDVIRAYIRSNARVTRNRVRKPLLEHGIDPEHYRADFEW